MPISAIPTDFPSPSLTTETVWFATPQQARCYIDADGPYKRLVVDISCAITHGFLSMPFICDTCAPGGLYLCKSAMRLMVEHKQLLEDDSGQLTATLHCKYGPLKVAVLPTPAVHEPANCIGLHALLQLGLKMRPSEFSFADPIQWLGGEAPCSPKEETSINTLDDRVQSLMHAHSETLQWLQTLDDRVSYLMEKAHARQP
jgi:hypothetical protein